MNLFDILGPVMVGPSSSHTAGAVRIGRMARALLGQEPVRAQLLLHGSFASTGEGHGTHQALVARAAGPLPGRRAGSQTASVWPGSGGCPSPSAPASCGTSTPTAPSSVLRMPGADSWRWGPPPLGAGASGSFRWMDCTPPSAGSCPPWWSTTPTSPAASVRSPACWAGRGLNVATLQLNRGGRGGSAVMVIECDQPIPEDAARDVRALPGILRVTRYTPEEQEVPL